MLPTTLEDETRPEKRADTRGRCSAVHAPDPLPDASFQLTMFGQPDPAVEALKHLDVESLSPLEAITKLFELKKMTK